MPPSAAIAASGPRCLGRPATIVGRGDIHGTAHADVIVASGGVDRIVGGGGDDRICAGSGDDRIEGGPGSDRIEAGAGDDEVIGGNGSDQVRAGAGNDTVSGSRGNDQLQGGPGTDLLDSGLGDDTLDGGPGDGDEVIGGIGTDHLFGREGDGDVLEGNFGVDALDGGPGAHDVASYALAGHGGVFTGGIGVTVDLAAGTADGDGDDTLTGIEDVVGTPFDDKISGNAEPNSFYGGGGVDDLTSVGPGDAAFGGTGLDRCRGAEVADSCELPGTGKSEAKGEAAEQGYYSQNRPPVFEVDLPGGPGEGSLTGVVEYDPHRVEKQGMQVLVSFVEGAWMVTEHGLALGAGEGCTLPTPETAVCPIATTPTGLFLDGGEGGDSLTVDGSVPSTVSSTLIGGRGIDTLVGGAGDDSLEGSIEGLAGDVLYGGPGDDALVGGALIEGGGGSDLLIASPCGQTIEGGPGLDSVSFARIGERGVIATLGGYVTLNYPIGYCPVEPLPGQLSASRIESSVERMEGSPNADILTGDGGPNVILGRGDDDQLHGAGGEDFLVGGGGSDALFGEAGADRLYLRDGNRDSAIDCGPAAPGDVALADSLDPRPVHCRDPAANRQ